MGKGNLYLTENWAADNHNHNYVSHMRERIFRFEHLVIAVIVKISIFHEIAPNLTYSQKS